MNLFQFGGGVTVEVQHLQVTVLVERLVDAVLPLLDARANGIQLLQQVAIDEQGYQFEEVAVCGC